MIKLKTRAFDFNDWLLFSIELPSTSNARGFTGENIFTLERKFIAPVAQESEMRSCKKYW